MKILLMLGVLALGAFGATAADAGCRGGFGISAGGYHNYGYGYRPYGHVSPYYAPRMNYGYGSGYHPYGYHPYGYHPYGYHPYGYVNPYYAPRANFGVHFGW